MDYLAVVSPINLALVIVVYRNGVTDQFYAMVALLQSQDSRPFTRQTDENAGESVR